MSAPDQAVAAIASMAPVPRQQVRIEVIAGCTQSTQPDGSIQVAFTIDFGGGPVPVYATQAAQVSALSMDPAAVVGTQALLAMPRNQPVIIDLLNRYDNA